MTYFRFAKNSAAADYVSSSLCSFSCWLMPHSCPKGSTIFRRTCVRPEAHLIVSNGLAALAFYKEANSPCMSRLPSGAIIWSWYLRRSSWPSYIPVSFCQPIRPTGRPLLTQIAYDSGVPIRL